MHCKWSVVCQKKMCIIRPPCLLVLSQERWHWYVYFFNKRSYKRRASFHALTYILYVLSKSVCHWSVELQIRDFSCLHYHWHCPHMLRGAGSMHLSGVRPSVRRSVCPNMATNSLLRVYSCGRRYLSIAARRTAAQRAGRRANASLSAEYRLYYSGVISTKHWGV